jgi:hypothetical protein
MRDRAHERVVQSRHERRDRGTGNVEAQALARHVPDKAADFAERSEYGLPVTEHEFLAALRHANRAGQVHRQVEIVVAIRNQLAGSRRTHAVTDNAGHMFQAGQRVQRHIADKLRVGKRFDIDAEHLPPEHLAPLRDAIT